MLRPLFISHFQKPIKSYFQVSSGLKVRFCQVGVRKIILRFCQLHTTAFCANISSNRVKVSLFSAFWPFFFAGIL